jgi:hypothetical protein
MASTVASSTPFMVPFQPAWAAPITPASPSAKRAGWQSAVRIESAIPGTRVTMASARGRGEASGPSTVTTSAECTWWTPTSASGATPIVWATRARLIVTASAWSVEPWPQFRPWKMPDDAPPSRPKKPWRSGSSSAEVMMSRLTVRVSEIMA